MAAAPSLKCTTPRPEMVNYKTFFGIVHETASSKGLSGPGSSASRRNLTSEAADFWKNNEATVRSWSRREAREWAEQNVKV